MNRDHLLFDDPAAATAWAFIRQLSPAAQHLLLAELRQHLVLAETGPSAARQREARATAALHECLAVLVEEDPTAWLSVGAYRRLRAANPEAGWPEDSSIRRWLGGGSWNDALRRARIAAVPDGDRLVVCKPREFSAEHACAALQLCAAELAEVPGVWQYISWARRDEHWVNPDIPKSQVAFMRLFGSWDAALTAAGLLTDLGGTAGGVERGAGYVRPAAYRYTPEQTTAPIRDCAAEVGRSPRQTEYDHWRGKEQARAREAGGQVPALPCSSTLMRRFGTWDGVLVAAGLDALGGKATRSNPRRPAATANLKRWNDDELLDVIDRAVAEFGNEMTTGQYNSWRTELVAKAKPGARDRRLPCKQTIRERFGRWQDALQAARDRREAGA